jgi:hypothetical protein
LTAVKLTNDYIAHEHAKEGMFATLFFGVINPLSRHLRRPPIWWTALKPVFPPTFTTRRHQMTLPCWRFNACCRIKEKRITFYPAGAEKIDSSN